MKHNINEETTYFTIKTYSSEMLVETNQHDPEDAPIASAYDEALSNLHDTNYRLYTKTKSTLSCKQKAISRSFQHKNDQIGNVVNFSRYIYPLNKNLNFCST